MIFSRKPADPYRDPYHDRLQWTGQHQRLFSGCQVPRNRETLGNLPVKFIALKLYKSNNFALDSVIRQLQGLFVFLVLLANMWYADSKKKQLEAQEAVLNAQKENALLAAQAVESAKQIQKLEQKLRSINAEAADGMDETDEETAEEVPNAKKEYSSSVW